MQNHWLLRKNTKKNLRSLLNQKLRKIRIDPTVEKVKILQKKILKIQVLFNFQNIDTIMFGKSLAIKKKYLIFFEMG